MRLLLGLYGDGLGRSWTPSAESAAGDAVRDRLRADPLVESLLLLHDLHPLEVDVRIQRALDRVRPSSIARRRRGISRRRRRRGRAPAAGGQLPGCPSSTVTVRLAIEGAVQDAAPEVTEVVVEGMTDPSGQALLQIGRRPPDAGEASPDASRAAGDSGWPSTAERPGRYGQRRPGR